MKKLIIVLIFMAVISPVFAQQISKEHSSEMYYRNVPVEKIYPSGRGYVVQYLRNTGEIGTIGLPNEWFMGAGAGKPGGEPAAIGLNYIPAGKAEVLSLPGGKNWPSLTVFYKEGKFDHVKLYVHKAKSHQTWGNIPQGMDVSRYFSDDPDTLNIKY